MEMSIVEIAARANYLVYDYLKTHLRCNDLADEFRKTIQENSQHKDLITFKGLEDLPTVLRKYYSSSQATEAAAAATVPEPNGSTAMPDGVSEPAAVPDGTGSLKKKKKKNKKSMEQQPAADSEQMEQEEAVAADEDDGVAKRRKEKKEKKRLRRQLEAEQAGAEEAAAVVATTGDSVDEEAPKKKKRKRAKEAAAQEAQEAANGDVCAPSTNGGDSAAVQAEAPNSGIDAEDAPADAATNGGGVSGGKKSKRHSQPYRRVREEEVDNKHFQDNSFDAKPGSAAGWGFKANMDLKPTQGRSFRHEKTKKKRGSYKGGAIDTGVSSFKFDSDSE